MRRSKIAERQQFADELSLRDKEREQRRATRYPKGAVHKAIDSLELAYSYLRDRPVIEKHLTDALDRLYRARELQEGTPHPYRKKTGREVA